MQFQPRKVDEDWMKRWAKDGFSIFKEQYHLLIPAILIFTLCVWFTKEAFVTLYFFGALMYFYSFDINIICSEKRGVNTYSKEFWNTLKYVFEYLYHAKWSLLFFTLIVFAFSYAFQPSEEEIIKMQAASQTTYGMMESFFSIGVIAYLIGIIGQGGIGTGSGTLTYLVMRYLGVDREQAAILLRETYVKNPNASLFLDLLPAGALILLLAIPFLFPIVATLVSCILYSAFKDIFNAGKPLQYEEEIEAVGETN